MPLVNAFSRMLQRNLLYTGLTRASESLVLLGEPMAYKRAVDTEGVNRQTTLQERLAQARDGQLPEVVTTETTVATLTDEVGVAELADEGDVTDELVVPEPEKVAEPSPSDDQLTVDLIQQEIIDPNVGMAGMTPYDFA
jgi:exodeoxyribonuclease V alpha subunit